MNFLEKDLEEIIFNKFGEENGLKELAASGLVMPTRRRYERQKRIGGYGVADILGISYAKDEDGDVNYYIDVYELKKDKIGTSAFLQAVGYCKGIQRYLISRGIDKWRIHTNIVLIGKSIDTSDNFIYLTDILNCSNMFLLRFYTYEYDFDGIKFVIQKNYSLINEGL